MRLDRLRLMVAGSLAPDCDPALARYAHEIVLRLAAQLAPHGVRFEVMLGKKPDNGRHGQPVAFDWVLAQGLARQLRTGVPALTDMGALVSSSMSQKTLAAIPGEYRADWDALQQAGAVEVRFIDAGWSSGAVRRSRSAECAHALLAIGGGEGVEHLAQEFLRQGKAVIPLDLTVGSSFGDGTGGAPRLFGSFLAGSNPPFRVQTGISVPTLLAGLSTGGGTAPIDNLVRRLQEFLEALAPPQAFYVRLLATDQPDYPAVEDYFRKVVDPVVQQLGFESVEMGRTGATEPWMNSQIFRSLHNCGLAIIDLTGLRPNCFIELGYALGRNRCVIVTAQEKTRLPFDITQYSSHFWRDPRQTDSERKALLDHWAQVHSRPPLVST